MIQHNQRMLSFHQELEHQTGIKLHLKINDNRSTMLSVKWEPDVTKVSLHRMFLEAPQNIMQALGCYLKGEHKKIAPIIKDYIETQIRNLDYSHELDLSKLQTKGCFYDLQKIYQQLNEDYFNNQLNLFITWFGQESQKKCNRVTFGLFHDPLRLIKINRLLDHPRCPAFFITYVIFHEILHSIFPPFVDEKGFKHIHSKAFKEREKEYPFYQQAQKWIKDNHHDLFNGSFHTQPLK